MGVCLLFPLFFCWSLPPGCLGIKVAIRFLEVLPSWCCCLGGLGDICLSPVACLDVGQVKARRLLLVSLQLLVA